MNEFKITQVFIEQPLASPGSAKKLQQKLKKEKVDCLEVIYHLTAYFYLNAPALMHSKKGFPSLT